MDQAEIDVKLGGFNQMPPNWRKITLSEFLWLWAVKPASRTRDYRQAKIADRYHDVNMFIFPDFSGIGWITYYDGRATRADVDAYQADWFKFDYCDHDWETITQRMSYWEGECKLCGYRKAVDSSD